MMISYLKTKNLLGFFHSYFYIIFMQLQSPLIYSNVAQSHGNICDNIEKLMKYFDCYPNLRNTKQKFKTENKLYFRPLIEDAC